MTEFDRIKALREELAGLTDVQKIITMHTRESERKLAEVEADHNAFIKMEGCLKGLVDSMRHKLMMMEAETNRPMDGD